MWRLLFVFCLSLNLAFGTDDDGSVIYDKFTAEPVTDEVLSYFENNGLTSTCAIKVKTCNESEPRRTDGTCNNLNKPSMGTYYNPQLRILPASFGPNSTERLASTGRNLTASRDARTKLLYEGKSISLDFTQAIPSFIIFSFGDIGSTHDISFFLINKTDCCDPGHMNDELCTVNIVAEDDPVHKLTGIRCLNLTKPLDYQYLGCTNDSTPAPIAPATAIMDLSQIYNAEDLGEAAIRLYEGGLLKTETDENGVVWPPSGYGQAACIGNVAADNETRCWRNYPTALFGIVLNTVWLLRNHNNYAKQLAKVNPQWDDDKLYNKARDLNIATYIHILYDEVIVALTGSEYLIERGLKLKGDPRVDRYDKTKAPQTTMEYTYILRYFHTAQEPIANKYDSKGNVVGGFSQTQLAFRPGFAGKDTNIRDYTPSMYRQPCAALDHGTDPDLTQTGLPVELQRSVDILTSDLHKGLTLGIAPYIDYVNYCYGVKITSWDDLKQYFDDENIALLRTVYSSVEDVELMAAAWLEKKIEGGHISSIVGCIVVDFLKRNLVSDRHFYERPNRPDAFTDCQLEQVKKTSLASVICANADGVTAVQKEAFKVINETNPLISCDEIPTIDFSVFAESS